MVIIVHYPHQNITRPCLSRQGFVSLAGGNCLRRMVLDYGYNPLAAVTRSRNAAWNVPKAHLIEFGLVFEV